MARAYSRQRICFQIEEAHWYYEDFIREINTSLPNLHLRNFIHQVLSHVPQSVVTHIPIWKTETAFTDFMAYKTRVPVRGCIMLNVNMDKVVLVKGWKSSSSWCFPRGKIDKDEDDRDCAIREVLEETGFDLTGMVGAVDKIDINIREQNMRLYIAPGVPEDAEFAPRTRKEISVSFANRVAWLDADLMQKIAWHKLSELPGYSAKKGPGNKDIRQAKFFLVAPFIRDLRKWISTKGKAWLAQQAQEAASKQDQMASAVENIEEAEEEPLSLPLSQEESNAELKGLLGIPETASEFEHGQMNAAERDDASRRLNEMIGVRPHTPIINGSSHGPAPTLSENPNAKVLLSILQSGPTTSLEPASHGSPPTHISPHPHFMTHPLPGIHNQLSSLAGPQQFQQPQPLSNRQLQHGQPFANQLPPMGWPQSPNGMHQNNGFHQSPGASNQRFGTPSMMGHQPFPHQNSNPQMNQFHPHQQRNVPRTFAQQSPHRASQPGPPLPSRPQDPGQAGALLSILKGTGPPPPVANSQPLATAVTPPLASQPQPEPPKSATPLINENTPPNQMSPNAMPRGAKPQSPQQQRHIQRQRVGIPNRSSTALPPPQAYAPPPRPSTAQRGHMSPPPPLRHGTPVVLDHYGAKNAPAAPPSAQFDRRESVSGERAKTLLAMFKMAPPSSPSAMDEAVMSSPEMEMRNPVTRIPARLSTPTSASQSLKAKSPVGKDRAGLLAYLENVANQGGVSLS